MFLFPYQNTTVVSEIKSKSPSLPRNTFPNVASRRICCAYFLSLVGQKRYHWQRIACTTRADRWTSYFNAKILLAGSAPKDSTFNSNVGGELAPGQANNAADTTCDNRLDVHKSLRSTTDGESKKGEENGHHTEIKSATERKPKTAQSLWVYRAIWIWVDMIDTCSCGSTRGLSLIMWHSS